MKKFCEYLWLLRYKMWMMGIIVDKPLFVEKINWYLRTPGKTDSILKKKTCVIAYHCVCEGCRWDECRIWYIYTEYNCEYFMMNPFTEGVNRYQNIERFLYDIYPKYGWCLHYVVLEFQSSMRLMYKIWGIIVVIIWKCSGDWISMVTFKIFLSVWFVNDP